jgi:hypothetical protein
MGLVKMEMNQSRGSIEQTASVKFVQKVVRFFSGQNINSEIALKQVKFAIQLIQTISDIS